MTTPLFVTMKIRLACLALTSVLALSANAQSPSHPPQTVNPAGVWRGTSVCLVRPSACNDEIVVYRITPMKSADSLAIDARKIVRGEEQEMGVLGCRLVSPNGQLTCVIPQGVWKFTVRNDSLIGELRARDNTKLRDVRAARTP